MHRIRNNHFWTKEEDELLLKAIDKYNREAENRSFPQVPSYLSAESSREGFAFLRKELDQKTDRSIKQIREHYFNQLSPRVVSPIQVEHEEEIVRLYKKIGPSWSLMSKHLYQGVLNRCGYYPDNSLKNFINRRSGIKSFVFVPPVEAIEKKRKLETSLEEKSDQVPSIENRATVPRKMAVVTPDFGGFDGISLIISKEEEDRLIRNIDGK